LLLAVLTPVNRGRRGFRSILQHRFNPTTSFLQPVDHAAERVERSVLELAEFLVQYCGEMFNEFVLAF
jgi:hypothetical protein